MGVFYSIKLLVMVEVTSGNYLLLTHFADETIATLEKLTSLLQKVSYQIFIRIRL